jgi:nicotinamide-nucleotide amidase
MVASSLTETPGSSEVYKGSVVAYDNAVKRAVLHVPQETLESHGAVSAETVRAMAAEVRKVLGTTYGIATSGIAGPGGGSVEKPVGLFYVGVSGPHRSFELRCVYGSERRSVRTFATYVALDLLRRELEGLEIPDTYPVLAGNVAPKA